MTITNSIAISTILDLIVAIWIIRRLESGKILVRFSKYTLLQLNLLILIICHVIIGKEISLEAGIGIFALLAMIRFRSEILRMEEMIATLIIIGLGFIHAACPSLCTFPEVIAFDIMILGVTFVATKSKKESHTLKMKIFDLDLIHPENRKKLTSKLEQKTGYKFKSFRIQSVDMKEKQACLLVHMENVRSKKTALVKRIPDEKIEFFECLPDNVKN